MGNCHGNVISKDGRLRYSAGLNLKGPPMDDLNRSRPHILAALYEKAVFVGTIKNEDSMLVLFRSENGQGLRGIDHARRSFNHYHGTEIPQEAILMIGGYAGIWLPSHTPDAEGKLQPTPEFDHLNRRAGEGSILAVQEAANKEDFNRKYSQCMTRLHLGERGLN